MENLFEWFVKMFQCFRTILVIFSIDWLYVNTSRILVSFEVVLILKVLSCLFFLHAFLCLFICSCLKAWLANHCLSTSHYWLKPFGIVQINLIASIWLYWKLSFSDILNMFWKFQTCSMLKIHRRTPAPWISLLEGWGESPY